jgi:hypothetical protein
MSRWISITVDDLNDQKLAPLVEAFRTKGLAPDQDDPLPRLTQAVVNRIRRKIASNLKNRLDSDETKIPAGLKTLAVDLIYAELKGHLEEALTADEVKKIATHEADLNLIAKGIDVIEEPDDPIDAQVESTAGSPSVSIGRRETLNASRGGM